MKSRLLNIVDLFCGAGGLSEAASLALKELKRPYKLRCLNHWPLAIETHKANHPEAEHFCQDIAAARPIVVVPEGYLDLLIAAPTCTYHSRARGGRPTSDQQRMDPWHIITWLTELRVKRLLLENVPEIIDWGPVDARTGRPLKRRRGEYFAAWIAAIEALGFRVQWRMQVCADYGDATTRKRFILQARSDGKRIEWPEPTHAKVVDDAAPRLFAPAIKVQPWRPARDCIDWSIPGQSIFGRKQPLSAKTILRIHAGVTKFAWPEPFLVILRQHMAARSINLPMPTITAGGSHIGIAQAFIMPQQSANPSRDVTMPLPAATTIPRIGLVEPFVLAQAQGGVAREIREPLPTIPGGGAHALLAPYYGSGSGLSCGTVNEPMPTISTKDRFGLVVPITHTKAGNNCRSVDQPFQTLTTAKGGELAFVTAAFGERDGQSPRVHSIEEPVPTVLAQGRINLAVAANDDAGRIYDIHYRMLASHELAAAHSFNAGRRYVFKGNKTQVNKQIGNSVPVLTGKAHVSAVFHDLRVAA